MDLRHKAIKCSRISTQIKATKMHLLFSMLNNKLQNHQKTTKFGIRFKTAHTRKFKNQKLNLRMIKQILTNHMYFLLKFQHWKDNKQEIKTNTIFNKSLIQVLMA